MSYTAEFWQYDARLGRRWNIDPMFADKPWMSPYHAFSNKPILNVDPSGATDDNYLIKADGSIEVEKTDDNFDQFFYENKDGSIELLEKRTKQKNEAGRAMLHIDSDGKYYQRTDVIFDNMAKGYHATYIDPKAWAGFLGAAKEFFELSGRKLYLNQISTLSGSHSGHFNQGWYLDIRYVSNDNSLEEKYRYKERVYAIPEIKNNFDYDASLQLVNLFIKYGFDKHGGKGSVITQWKGTTDEIFPNTGYVNKHWDHIHLQGYNRAKIKVVTTNIVRKYIEYIVQPIEKERNRRVEMIGKEVMPWFEK